GLSPIGEAVVGAEGPGDPPGGCSSRRSCAAVGGEVSDVGVAGTVDRPRLAKRDVGVGEPAASPVAVEPAADRGRARGTAARIGLAHWGPPTVMLGLVIAGWYFISNVVLDPRRRFLLPPPHRVVDVGFLDGGNR